MAGPSFRQVRLDIGDGAVLLAEYAAEIAAMYDGADLNAPGMPTAGPAEFAAPAGAFLAGYVDRTPLCCGGLKQLGAGIGEIKRMYVVPGARRQGIARLLLVALEDAARERGYLTVRMDTGSRHQHAIRFYEAEGYLPVEDYNGNPLAAWWGQKSL
jgi:GNAT superfamily N-acetyltransferase